MVNANETGETPQPAPGAIFSAKINIIDIRQMIMIWPATMFANKRMINANGLMNTLKNSTGTRINFTPNGTPGGLKICPQ